MRLSRDLLFFLLLFALLIGLAVISAVQRAQSDRQSQQNLIPYSTHSSESNGMLALQSWLDAAGFRTVRIENQAFRVNDDARALVVFDPYIPINEADANSIITWVELGNTLIIAQQLPTGADPLLRALQVDLNFLDRRSTTAALEQPLQGQLRGAKINIRTVSNIVTERSDYVAYLSAEGKPLLITFPQGRGSVWFASAPELFDNDNLQQDANAALVLAMFSRVPRGSLVAFDEYHLGLVGSTPTQARTIQQLLYGTAWGWGILYTILIALAYLFVNGKRFGRAVPLPKDIERRSPAEYVTSMANLYRRAGKRGLVARHYHRQLKRLLGRPYRINADLSDEEFVEELSHYRDSLDRDGLLKTLRALARQNADERGLIKLADQAVQFTMR